MKLHFEKTLLIALTAVALTACGGTPKETRFSDIVKGESAQMQSISKQWDKGDALVTKGDNLISQGKKEVKKGEKLVDKGEDNIDDGEAMIKKGKALKSEAEALYKIQKQKELVGSTPAQ